MCYETCISPIGIYQVSMHLFNTGGAAALVGILNLHSRPTIVTLWAKFGQRATVLHPLVTLSGYLNFNKRNIATQLTHVFPCDGANVFDILDLPLVLHHTHGNGIVTNL